MPENDTERRYMRTEVRAEKRDGKPVITGLSPVYNQRSSVLIERGRKFIEVILPNALDEVLPVSDVRGRYNHEMVMARTKSGTLELENTEEGLRYTIHVNENDPNAMGIYARVERGDVDGSSFAFNVAPDGEMTSVENGTRIRYINKISSLLDVGPVDYPAYPTSTTSASFRSLLDEPVPDETLQHEETPPEPDQAASSGAEDQAKVRAHADARRRSLRLLGVKTTNKTENVKGTRS